MDKQLLQQIRVDMNAALLAVAKKHGLQHLTAGNCSFDPMGCFSFKVNGVTGNGLSLDAARYENMRSCYGLPPVKTQFKFKGDCTITGMTSGGKVIYERGGKSFVVNAEELKLRLK